MQGAMVLANCIKSNHSIRELWLGGNKIGDAGALTLAEVRARRHTLARERARTDTHQIGDTGAV